MSKQDGTSGTDDAPPLLDQARLDGFLAEVGSQAAPLLLQSLHKEITVTAQVIAHATVSYDWHMIEVKAHALKSAAATFGAMRLRNICRTLEENATDQRSEVLIVQQYEQFAQVVAATYQAFGWID